MLGAHTLMHPIVRDFSRNRPRVYGLLALVVALGLAWLGRRVPAPPAAFLLLVLSAGYGVTGAVYLVFGAQAHRWDVRFEETFSPFTRLSWRMALTAIGVALGLSGFAGALYWLLRR